MLVLEREQKLKLKQEKHIREIKERCKRIHDVKWTFNGIDKAALDKQVQEKREREEQERKSKETYEKNWVDTFAKAYELQKKEEEDKRRKERDIDEYRRTHQAPHTRVSYDLNEPCARRNAAFPNRDDPEIVGTSSVQKMQGEDLNACTRLRIQQEQNRAWLDQQIFEKKRLQEQRKSTEENYLKVSLSQQDIIRENMEREREQKLKIHRDLFEFNKKLAEEKAKKLREEKCKQAGGDNFTMQSSLGPVLTEHSFMSGSSQVGGRIVSSLHKGLSGREKFEFRKELEKQIEEATKRKEHECKSQCEWDQQYVKMYKEGLLRAREEERKRKQIEMRNIEENRKIAAEQKAIKKEKEKQLQNEFCEDFFDQFEKSP